MATPLTNSERWRHIDELFQQAVSLPPQRRAEFLAQACGADAELRREVESLLAVQSAAQRFFPAEPVLSRPPVAQPDAQADEFAASVWFPRLALFGIVVSGVLFLLMGWVILKYLGRDRFGFVTNYLGNKLCVSMVMPGTPAAGKLRAGDELLAINDERLYSRVEAFVALRRLPPDAVCRVLVRRAGLEQLVEFSAAPYPSHDLDRLRYHLYGFPRGLLFLGLAVLTLLLWRERRLAPPLAQFARVALPVCLTMSLMNLRQMIFPLRDQFSGWEIWFESVVLLLVSGNNFIPFSYHASLLFPPGAPLPASRFWTALRNLLYASTLGLAVTSAPVVLSHHSEPIGVWLYADGYGWFHFFRNLREYHFPLGLICICAVLARNFRLLQDAQQRLRAKLFSFGILLGVIPMVLLLVTDRLVRTLDWHAATWERTYHTALWFADAGILLIPLVLGYAVLTRRVYNLGVIVRRGLQYLLVRNVLSLILLLPLLALCYRLLSQPDQTIRQVLFAQPLTLGLSALAALGLAYRRQLRTWLDRRFFRAQYDQEQVLYKLIDEIRAVDDLPALCRRVEQTLTATLHPQGVRFFLRQAPARDLRVLPATEAPAAGMNAAETVALPETSALYQLLKDSPEPLALPLPRGTALPPHEARQLADWQASLLVPLHDSQAQLVGLLLLGEKRSEEPYSPGDRRLLAALARQLATVAEVAQLRGQVSQQAQTEHAVLARLTRLTVDEVNLLRECPQCGGCYDVTEASCQTCNAALVLTLPIERTLAGRYRLDQRIGAGGMGAVYRAADRSLRRAVAVKVIKAECFGDASLLRRFEREAQAAARLDHPNIVRVFDYGRTATGGAWLVMELLRGQTLREVLRQHGRLTPRAALPWFAQLLAGLGAAHQAGVIHRDLKPENLLLNQPPEGARQLKILDFGLAKLLPLGTADQHSLPSATLPGLLVGTLGYMAPEQLAGAAADERADIYAVGILLTEALTGTRPARSLTGAPSHTQLPPLPGAVAAVNHAALNAVLQKCLAEAPPHRYPSAAALQAELLPVLAAWPEAESG